MDFQTALQCHVCRDEVLSLGLQSQLAILADFPFHTINSFDDLAKYLSRNMLLGDDAGTVILQNSGTAAAPSSTVTSPSSAVEAASARALQRYFQLHALTWPNAIVRTVIPKSKMGALVEINKDLKGLLPADFNTVGSTSATPSVYRVGVVRSVSFSLPKQPAGGAAPQTGPSESLQAFVSDYLVKMINFTIDFGDAIDEKFNVKFVSNDAFSADEYAVLTAAIIAGASSKQQPAASSGRNGGGVFVNPTMALDYFFKEAPSTTQMRLYSCRLVGGSNNNTNTNNKNSTAAATAAIPKRNYSNALTRSFIATEPLQSFGGLYLTRAVQQLFAVEGIDMPTKKSAIAAAGEETDAINENNADGLSGEDNGAATLTYSELSVILNDIVAPQLERMQQLILEQSAFGGGGGGVGVGASSSSMAQLEESRKEVYTVQQSLKEAREKSAQLQAEVDRLQKELANEKTNVRNALTSSAQLTKALETWRTRALDNRMLLTEARSMLNMNENAGAEEVVHALRRKLGQ